MDEVKDPARWPIQDYLLAKPSMQKLAAEVFKDILK